jgi:hypothetical protein
MLVSVMQHRQRLVKSDDLRCILRWIRFLIADESISGGKANFAAFEFGKEEALCAIS